MAIKVLLEGIQRKFPVSDPDSGWAARESLVAEREEREALSFQGTRIDIREMQEKLSNFPEASLRLLNEIAKAIAAVDDARIAVMAPNATVECEVDASDSFWNEMSGSVREAIEQTDAAARRCYGAIRRAELTRVGAFTRDMRIAHFEWKAARAYRRHSARSSHAAS